MTSWQKTIKYIAIAFAMLLIVSIIVGIVGTLTSLSFIFGDKDIVGELQTYSIDSDIKELEIDVSAADFVIKTGSDFHVESNHKYLTVEEKNGSLVISEKKRFWGTYSGKVSLELYVPEGTVFEKADIATGAGRVTIETLSAEVLVLNLGAGEVKIDNLIATERAEIDGGAGSITISDGTLRNLDLDMGVGELKLTSKLTGNSDLDFGVGATELVLVGAADDYKIKLDKGLGEAKIDGESISNGGIYGNGENTVDIDGGIGAIKITFRASEE